MAVSQVNFKSCDVERNNTDLMFCFFFFVSKDIGTRRKNA